MIDGLNGVNGGDKYAQNNKTADVSEKNKDDNIFTSNGLLDILSSDKKTEGYGLLDVLGVETPSLGEILEDLSEMPAPKVLPSDAPETGGISGNIGKHTIPEYSDGGIVEQPANKDIPDIANDL